LNLRVRGSRMMVPVKNGAMAAMMAVMSIVRGGMMAVMTMRRSMRVILVIYGY
jgi:hypothetical protein